MTQAAAGSELDERVPGRRWIVRLDERVLPLTCPLLD